MSDDDNALRTHVVFFDVDGDGHNEAPEIYRALRELGFSRTVSLVATPALALALPGDVAEAAKLRHDDSGALDAEGAFDEAAFLKWWEASDTNDDDRLTRWELLLSSWRLSDDAVSAVASVAEFQLLHLLLAEDGGLRREPVRRFLSGELFQELMAKRG